MSKAKFHTEIPNIILKILEPYELVIYCHIKRLAGESDQCCYSVSDFRRITGFSERKIRQVLEKFSQPFKELTGNPLVKITARYDEFGGNLSNLIQLTPIEGDNVAFCSKEETLDRIDWNENVPWH